MFYANLGSIDEKVSCYVMHKHLLVDSDTLAREFNMDASPPMLKVRSFPKYRKELAINMLFLKQNPVV